jgi:hypothetical protein
MTLKRIFKMHIIRSQLSVEKAIFEKSEGGSSKLVRPAHSSGNYMADAAYFTREV